MPFDTLNLKQVQLQETGGGQIGLLNATYPFAKLTVSNYCLSINMGICKVLFRPADVISIKPLSGIKRGIRIEHRVTNYKSNVVFICSSSPIDLIAAIEQTGFTDNMDPLPPPDIEAETAQAQASGSFGLKSWFAIGVLIVWNLLLLPGILALGSNWYEFGMAMRTATGFMTGLTLLLLFVPALQQRALKPGFSIKDMRIFFYFLLFIAGVMFVASSLMPFK